MKGYWFADREDESEGGFWRIFLDTEDGMIFPLEGISCETKELCEEWIEQYVLGRDLRRD